MLTSHFGILAELINIASTFTLYNKDDRFLLLCFCNPRICTNRFYNISYFIINRQLKLKYVYFLSHGSHYHLFFSLFRLKLKWLKNGVKTGSYFQKYQKYRPLEIDKNVFSANLSQKFLIFHVWSFSENVQCFVGGFL